MGTEIDDVFGNARCLSRQVVGLQGQNTILWLVVCSQNLLTIWVYLDAFLVTKDPQDRRLGWKSPEALRSTREFVPYPLKPSNPGGFGVWALRFKGLGLPGLLGLGLRALGCRSYVKCVLGVAQCAPSCRLLEEFRTFQQPQAKLLRLPFQLSAPRHPPPSPLSQVPNYIPATLHTMRALITRIGF